VGRTDEAERIVAEFEQEARAQGHQLDEPTAANLSSQSPASSATAKSLGVLFRHPYAKRTAMMVVFHLFQTIGYYGFGTMVPLVLAAKGFPVG
jgi:putative MFS transporter